MTNKRVTRRNIIHKTLTAGQKAPPWSSIPDAAMLKASKWTAKSKREKRKRHDCRQVERTNPLKCAAVWSDVQAQRETRPLVAMHAVDVYALKKIVCLRRKVCPVHQRVYSCLCASISNQPPLVRHSAGESVLSESDVCLHASTCFPVRVKKKNI